MARRQLAVIPNQIFVGLPWRNVRLRYEKCIEKLEQKYPLYFTIVGRKDAQDAVDLLQLIKDRMDSSSYGIFDVTGNNLNVLFEYGYAEAVELRRVIYLSTHKATSSSRGDIISDLGGKRRVEYKNEQSLNARLEAFSKDHNYTRRFEAFVAKRVRATKKGAKKRQRTLALKMIHYLDGKPVARRAALVQATQVAGYSSMEVEDMVKKLHAEGLLTVSRGRTATVKVAKRAIRPGVL